MAKNIIKENPSLKSDDIIKAHGCVPLHLPPYHCEVCVHSVKFKNFSATQMLREIRFCELELSLPAPCESSINVTSFLFHTLHET